MAHAPLTQGEGRFERGKRHGAWRFFHDDRARVPVSEGQFDDGRLVGRGCGEHDALSPVTPIGMPRAEVAL